MCTPGYSTSNAAQKLAELIEKYRLADWQTSNNATTATVVREMIQNDWSKLCVLAHQVHDEETAPRKFLERAVYNISALEQHGWMNVIDGTAGKDVIEAAKIVARAILKDEK